MSFVRWGQTLGLVFLMATGLSHASTQKTCEAELAGPHLSRDLLALIQNAQDESGPARTLTNLKERLSRAFARMQRNFLTTPTISTMLAPLDQIIEEIRTAQNVMRFLSGINESSSKLQSARIEFEVETSKMMASLSHDPDVQNWLATLVPRSEFETDLLNGLKHALGPALSPAAQRRQLDRLSARTQATAEFQSNLTSQQSTLALPVSAFPQELMNELGEHRQGDVVNLPVYNASLVRSCLTRCSSEAVRRDLYLAYRRRVPENAQHAVNFAHANAQFAQELGYKTWTDYRLSAGSLMNSSADLETFLLHLNEQIRESMGSLLERMRQLKAVDTPQSPLAPWDIYYYERLARQNRSETENWEETFADFFPAQAFLGRFLDFVSETFGLRFEEAEESGLPHPSLQHFRVWDQATGRFIGHLILDLYSRDFKNPDSQFVDELVAGTHLPGEEQVHPVVIMTTNFGPWSQRENLGLDVETVVTIGHEMGHALHALLQKGKAGVLSGLRMAIDLTEVPSTTLEQIVARPDVLIRLSGQAGNPDRRLPREIAEAASQAGLRFGILDGSIFSGSHQLPLIVLALMDFEIQKAAARGTSVEELRSLYEQALRGFFQLPLSLEAGDNLISTFHHGIDIEYHGYYSAYLIARAASLQAEQWLNEGDEETQRQRYRRFRTDFLERAKGSVTPQQILNQLFEKPLSLDPLLKKIRE